MKRWSRSFFSKFVLQQICLFTFLAMASCTSTNGWSSGERFPVYEGIDFRKGTPYKLLDSHLAGIIITHSPESAGRTRFKRTPANYPSGVKFVYWDGRYRNCSYNVSGELVVDNSLPTALLFCAKRDRLRLGDPVWLLVDFRWGSDPEFRHHKDPRPQSNAPQSNVYN
jgi:hypothetical protein